jgi:hypothetical protein
VVGLCKGAGVETYEDREVHWKNAWRGISLLSTILVIRPHEVITLIGKQINPYRQPYVRFVSDTV